MLEEKVSLGQNLFDGAIKLLVKCNDSSFVGETVDLLPVLHGNFTNE